MKSYHAIVAALGMAACLSLPVFAENPDDQSCEHHHQGARGEHGSDHGRGGMDHPPFEKILNLTDAQKQTLQAARTKQEASMKDLHEKTHAAHEALEKAGEANASDAELNKLSANLANLLAQQEVQRVKAHQQFLSVLTPDQKQKLAQWREEHKDDMAHHRPPM